MADTRHRFVSTEAAPARVLRRRPAAAPFLRFGAAWAVLLAAAVLVARPFLSRSPQDAGLRFAERHSQFRLLKDMLLAEPSVASVGVDNVREYWLFDGRWSSPRRPGQALSRADMLETVALSPSRYDAYLDLLKSVGAYRAVRTGTDPKAKVIVYLLPGPRGAGDRLVHDPSPAARGARRTGLGDGWFLEPGAG
jgi:hypothetical protein